MSWICPCPLDTDVNINPLQKLGVRLHRDRVGYTGKKEALLEVGMWKRLTASNLEDGIATSFCTIKCKQKRKRKRWKRHENRLLPHPYYPQF